jgi:hypothetical protein
MQLESILLIYDVTEQTILNEIPRKTNGFVVIGSKLYFIQKDSVYEYSLKKSKEKMLFRAKSDLSRIKSNGADKLAVANTKIFLIDLNGTLLDSYSGHSSNVLDMVFNSKYLFSCAQQDRFITCWGEKEKCIA